MRYVGGKSRLAKGLSKTMLDRAESRGTYWEPFVGGGSVLEKMAPHFSITYASDYSEDLILMWQLLQDGWVPDGHITKELYAQLKASEPSALRGLVGFGGSFGGKWFGGFAKGGFNADGTPRNHQAESARAVLRIMEALPNGVEFSHRSYEEILPQPGDVVYCDPPYEATQGYGAVGSFDSAKFWSVVNAWADSGVTVFVSEYRAPEGWDAVWEAQHRQSLVLTTQGRGVTTERLFMRA